MFNISNTEIERKKSPQNQYYTDDPNNDGRTIAGQFNERYTAPYSYIQNPTIDYQNRLPDANQKPSTKNNLTRYPTPRKRNKLVSINHQTNAAVIDNDNYQNPSPANINSKPRVPIKTLVSGVKKIALTSAYAWTSQIYLWVQIPFAILSIIVLGVAVYIQELIRSYPITTDTFATLMSSFGVDPDFNFAMVALFCLLLTAILGWIQLFGVVLQALFTGISPLNSTFKISTFLLALTFYIIPGANLLPLVFLYIASLQVAR